MKTINVCCAIIEEKYNGRVLVWAARKGKNSHLAGLWEFPGGKIEPNESPEQAIAREIEEELGVRISIIQSLAAHIHHYDTKSIILHPFVCSLASLKLPFAYEHHALALVTRDTLKKLAWAPADIPVVNEYLLRT